MTEAVDALAHELRSHHAPTADHSHRLATLARTIAERLASIDSFDAMTSDRASRGALPRRQACRRMRSGAGAHSTRASSIRCCVVGCGPLRRS